MKDRKKSEEKKKSINQSVSRIWIEKWLIKIAAFWIKECVYILHVNKENIQRRAFASSALCLVMIKQTNEQIIERQSQQTVA